MRVDFNVPLDDELAITDGLTGLYNKQTFQEFLSKECAQSERNRRKVTLSILDLDDFKVVNDSLGHTAGDVLLQELALRLQATVRKGDTVARLGGDEFTIVLESIDSPARVPEIAQKVLDAIARPFMLDERAVFLGASIGVSLYPQDGHDVTALMKYADVAMYKAKKDGGNRYQTYLADMTVAANQRLALETDIRHGLAHEEFTLHYQPQVRVSDRQIVGMEALVRWNHPQHGLLSPDVFIPIAEDAGLIEALGKWVMQTACRQARHWETATGKRLPVAVNLSGAQINDRLVQTVRDILDESGLEASCLELEITESSIMCDTAVGIDHLHKLRRLGVRLAIDDFGTGYSSMSYLKQLPVDALKIDRSFVRDVPHDHNDMEIIKAILALGHALGMTVIAEGVETGEQRDFLSDYDCDVIQGFLFSKPLPADELEGLLTRKPELRLVR